MGARTLAFAVAILLIASGCDRTSEPGHVTQSVNGVPQNGFPNASERLVLVLTNRARADPQTALASCKSCPSATSCCADAACYPSAVAPLGWNYAFNRSARFHATNLLRAHQAVAKCGLRHDSPCNLVLNIASLYPPNGTCNGDILCACQNDALTCPATTGTPPFTRIAYFGDGATGENAASGQTSPASVMDDWLLEPESDKTCGFRESNGHRVNLLNGDSKSLGNGFDSNWWVQDFGGAVTTGKLVAGAEQASDFLANWYDGSGPTVANVNVGGVCVAMSLERGTQKNGTYKAHVNGSGCRSYVFEFKDSANGAQRLPESGSYQTGCAADYTTVETPSCGTTPVDAGAPSTDAGTPPLDSGTPSRDSGTPSLDSGTPSPDSGTPPQDDAGIPPVAGPPTTVPPLQFTPDGGALDAVGGILGCSSGSSSGPLLAGLALLLLTFRRRS